MDAKPQENNLESRLKVIGVVVTVVSLLFAIAQFTWNQSVEAAKPYLEKKLAWCEEAVETTSFIATADPISGTVKTQRFKQLFWGVMGMVENENVSTAMSNFNTALNNQDTSKMKSASLDLAHACRQELANSWSPIWKPYWR